MALLDKRDTEIRFPEVSTTGALYDPVGGRLISDPRNAYRMVAHDVGLAQRIGCRFRNASTER